MNSSGASPLPTWTTKPCWGSACAALSLFKTFILIFPADTLRRTLNSTFHSPCHGGNPLNDDREREKFLHTLLWHHFAAKSHLPSPKIKHGFQQMDSAAGHKLRNQEAKGSLASHSKLGHLRDLSRLLRTGFTVAFKAWKSLNTDVPHWEHTGSRGCVTDPDDDYFLLIAGDINFKAEEKKEYICFHYCCKKG